MGIEFWKTIEHWRDEKIWKISPFGTQKKKMNWHSFFKKTIYLFVCTGSYLWHEDLQFLWDLVPQPGIELGPPGFGVRNLSHWATREVLLSYFLKHTHTYTCTIFLPYSFSQCQATQEKKLLPCPTLLNFNWEHQVCQRSLSTTLNGVQ